MRPITKTNKTMKIMVSGASGFVGKSICQILESDESAEYEIVKIGSLRQNGKKNISVLKNGDLMNDYVDIADRRSVLELEKHGEVSVIIHCAGLAHQFGNTEREKFFRVNALGTENIILLAKKLSVKRIVLISSVAVYGDCQEKSKISMGTGENSICRPQGFYAESKYESERTAVLLCRQNDVNLTILRPATIIGEEDPGNIYRLIKAVDQRKFVRIGKSLNKKSLIYKDDIGRACREIISRSGEKLEIFNLSADALSVREIVEIIAETLGKSIFKGYFPLKPVEYIFRFNEKTLKLRKLENISKTLKKWVSEDIFPAEKIYQKYGFRPQISSEEALRRECLWYKNKRL